MGAAWKAVSGNPGKAVPGGVGSAVTAADNDLGLGAGFAGFEVTVGGPSFLRPKFWALLRTALRPRCQPRFDDAGFTYREGGPNRAGGLYRNSRPAPALYRLPSRGDGGLIDCRSCKKPFVSKGLHCCSPECERQSRERQDIAATMAEVGMESTGYVYRKCQHCSGGNIPRYTGAGKAQKLTKSSAKFCSPKCSEKARGLVRSGTVASPGNSAQKAP
jgi:hypothetical protein